MDDFITPDSIRTLSPPALALRQLLEGISQRLFGAPWHPGITTLGWRLAVEPVGSVTVTTAAGPEAVAEARQALTWWAESGEVWLVETPDGLHELPIPHWIASLTPIEEPTSALADPDVQLSVAMNDTRCARCGAEINVGDTYGLVEVPGGARGWCCQDCVVGAATA
ncbi:MAG: hypothetical protein HKN26_10280 [Acidimicrobiales bacterium]|nr:hypothetical protein [Acidimicrobiales bacterium]